MRFTETRLLPPARFLDHVADDATIVDSWWPAADGETWGVLVHQGTAYTVELGGRSSLEAVVRFTAELWEEAE